MKGSPTAKLLTLTCTSQAPYIMMKLMLVFVFVFSLVTLTLFAAKIPQHEEGELLALNDDPSSYRGASLKRGMTLAGLCNCVGNVFIIVDQYS